MSDPQYEFTRVSRLQPEALGQPGKRAFRILADSASSSAIIWLEKEQLFQLALAIHQLLATMEEDDDDTPGEPPLEREAPGMTRLDFKVGHMVLRHDEERALFVIDAHDLEAGTDGPATVRLWNSRDLMEAFAEEAIKVCAAGRPLCPLCGGPINPDGHKCPRVNGHFQPLVGSGQ